MKRQMTRSKGCKLLSVKNKKANKRWRSSSQSFKRTWGRWRHNLPEDRASSNPRLLLCVSPQIKHQKTSVMPSRSQQGQLLKKLRWRILNIQLLQVKWYQQCSPRLTRDQGADQLVMMTCSCNLGKTYSWILGTQLYNVTVSADLQEKLWVRDQSYKSIKQLLMT